MSGGCKVHLKDCGQSAVKMADCVRLTGCVCVTRVVGSSMAVSSQDGRLCETHWVCVCHSGCRQLYGSQQSRWPTV